MLTLLIIWLAGGIANLGMLKGIMTVEGNEINNDVKIRRFIESWYAFGVILGIMITEINKNIRNKE